MQITEKNIINGGDFGFEGSIFAILTPIRSLITLIIAFLHAVYLRDARACSLVRINLSTSFNGAVATAINSLCINPSSCC